MEFESDVKERSSGIIFPSTLSPSGSTTDLKLGSVGAKTKWWLPVYAFGLYYEPEKASVELQRWNTYDMDELATNLSFYNALLSSKFDKAVRIVLAKAIKGTDFRSDLEENLKPRVKHYSEEYSHGHNKKDKR